jgi:uroporphyrinogen-III synthase
MPRGADLGRAGPGRAGPGRSLAGRRIIVTRPTDPADPLVRELRRRGATPVLAPTVELVPSRSRTLVRALDELREGSFAWVALTSRTTVDVLASFLRPSEVRAQVAAIGDGTAEAFRRFARRPPDLVPNAFTTTALARAFPHGSGRVLCARADIAPPGLESALAAKGWEAVRVDAYRTRLPRSLPPEARAALRAGAIDAVTFTSASTVRGFVRALLGPSGSGSVVRGNPKVVCIGPVTAREARAHGFRVSAVATPHTLEGLVTALERALTPRAGRATGAGGGPR